MSRSHSLFNRFLEGDLPNDFRQKVYQTAFENPEGIIDLLNLAIPEIEGLGPIVNDIRIEDPTFSLVKPRQTRDRLLAENRLDYLIYLHLEKLSCDIYLCVLHQSHEKKYIELEMAHYIMQQYIKDSELKKPLLGTLAVILNANVHSDWRPKQEFQEILQIPDNSLIKKSSLNFKIWSINVNDPKLKKLSHDKPLLCLLLLEQLRKPGLIEAEAIEVVKDAWSIIEVMNREAAYEWTIREEALLVCATYPEDPKVREAIVAFLEKRKYVEEKEAQAMSMYIEQVYDKGMKEGMKEGVEVAKRLTLKLAQKYLGSNPHLLERLESIQDFSTLEKLNDLLVEGNTEEFSRNLENISPKNSVVH